MREVKLTGDIFKVLTKHGVREIEELYRTNSSAIIEDALFSACNVSRGCYLEYSDPNFKFRLYVKKIEFLESDDE